MVPDLNGGGECEEGEEAKPFTKPFIFFVLVTRDSCFLTCELSFNFILFIQFRSLISYTDSSLTIMLIHDNALPLSSSF